MFKNICCQYKTHTSSIDCVCVLCVSVSQMWPVAETSALSESLKDYSLAVAVAACFKSYMLDYSVYV